MNDKSIRRTAGTKMAAVLAAMTMGSATLAAAAVTPELACQGGKNDASGKYASCVAKAEKGYVTGGDMIKYGEALAKCESKMVSGWSKLESKAVAAMTTCPSTGDQSAIEDFLDACAQSVAVAVGGGSLPLNVIDCNADLGTCTTDLATCDGDLAACQSSPGSMPLSTGQTTSFGAGSDGDLEKGGVRSFTDNGDGTITDNATGLMWEKKSDDDSIHDKDNNYTWGMMSAPYTMNGTMVTTFLADLNSGGGFAGHTDWRIPNLNELETIRNLQGNDPLVPATYAEFHSGCTGGCTVTTCSCALSDRHWSSSTYRLFPDVAWFVDFYGGSADALFKTNSYAVRAVRAGS